MEPQEIPTRAQLFLAAVGEQALTHRETAGFSIEEVAAGAGLAPAVVEAFERGHVDLTLGELQRLAEALSTTVFELLDVAGSELGISLGASEA